MSRIVFITSRFPYPINKGDQLRVFFQLKSLQQHNEVHLIALQEERVSEKLLQPLSFCESVNVYRIPVATSIYNAFKCFFNTIPFQVGYFYSRSVHKKILAKIEQINPDYIHCNLIRSAEYVKNIHGIGKSIDLMDAFSIGMKKRADILKNPLWKMLLLSEYRRLKKYERQMFGYFDRFMIISEQDAGFICRPDDASITIVPNGVDFESFYPRHEEKKYDICFMGNMSYVPNIEAVKYTMEHIFPLLLKRKPGIKFLIAGANPPDSIRKFQSQHVDVIDAFAHISDSIAMSRIMISPMVVSIGLQNKIIQAMAMKVPNVVSKSANLAILARHNSEVIEADKPAEYVDSIISLLEDPALYYTISENAFKFVNDNYNWDKINVILEKTIKGE